MDDFAKHYGRALTGGKHGTPQWNPPPHPEADPAVVAARDSDPLWQYHRNLRDYSGVMPKLNSWPEPPNDYHVSLGTQHEKSVGAPGSQIHDLGGDEGIDHTDSVPAGMVTLAEVRSQPKTNADQELVSGGAISHSEGGHLSASHPDNNARYQQLFGHGGGRRPWWNAVFPLQELEWKAAPHDPYRLLAASVKSGNRHALPALVDLLKKRDNPVGWSSVWPKLAKAMEERTRDLPPETVLRRVAAIAEKSAKHSEDPEGHRQLAAAAAPSTHGYSVHTLSSDDFTGQRHIRVHGPDGDWTSQRSGYRGTDEDAIKEDAAKAADHTGYLALADHMQENGLPQYAQLVRLELANLSHGFRQQPKRKGSRL